MKNTIKLAIAVVFSALFSISLAGKVTETTYKTTRVTPGDVLVSCRNGSQPKVRVLDDSRLVIVSCQ
jgi:hypothetical protein